MGNRSRCAALAVSVLALVAACSGDDDSGDDTTVITDPVETSDTTESTTSSSTSTTADPDAAVKAEVEEAYLAYLDAYLEIFAQPNPDNPLIDKYTTSAVRQVTLDAIGRNVLEGTSTQAPADPADYSATVKTVQLSGNTASINACVVDGTVVVQNATGTVLNDEVSTLHLDVVLQLEDGLWKVAESTIIERHEGRQSCDA